MDLAEMIPEHVRPETAYDFDIYTDPRLLADVHAGYAEVQGETPPIFFTPENGGHWIATRFDVISQIVQDPEHFSASQMQIPPVPGAPSFIPLNLDPPDNMPYRQILMPWFSPKSVNAMHGYLKEFAAELVDTVAKTGGCNFVGDVAARYPVGVFFKMMGLPAERFDDFREIALQFFSAHGGGDLVELGAIINGELAQVIEQHRKERKDDLVSYLLDAKIGDRNLTQEELQSMSFLLFLAGLDTVTNALSFGTRYLAGRPDLQARLRAEPEKIESAVDEVLRLFGVVNTPRVVTKDCERFGVNFRAGEMVLSLLPMAGHDVSKNTDPEAFDLDRKTRSHLTFSTGPHLCIGHFLARSEMKTLFTEWFSRIPEFRIADGYKPTFRAGMVMSLESLDLVWDGEAAAESSFVR